MIDKDLGGVGGCQVAKTDSELKRAVFHGFGGKKRGFSFTETRRFREEMPSEASWLIAFNTI